MTIQQAFLFYEVISNVASSADEGGVSRSDYERVLDMLLHFRFEATRTDKM